ncbi:MAG: hypothetical protein ACE5HS_10640 [bacterium]
MKIIHAFKAGIGLVSQSKKYLLMVYLINLAVAVMLGTLVSNRLEKSFGNSLASEKMLASWDDHWYRSYSTQVQGVARTFSPSVVGIGAVFNGLDTFLQGELREGNQTIVAVGLLTLLLWTFFSAGFISIYSARQETTSFFEKAAFFFPRFLGLAALAGVLYYLLFHFVLNWLNESVDELTRETIDERVHFAYTVIKYLLLWMVVWSVNLLFDYSKILTVVKDHKNFLTAPLQAVVLIFRNIGKTFGLYFSIGLLGIIFMLVYWLIAPGAKQSSWVFIAGTFVLGQFYLVSRIFTRCLFFAGQTAMFAAITSGEEKSEA